MMDARFRIARRQQFVRTAMARHAGGCLPISRLDGFSVIAAIISGLLVGVAARTGDLGRRGFMRRRFDIGVAIDAGKHSAMDRCLEPFRVDVEADRLAVNVLRHGGIAMTGQAFLIGGLGSGRLWDGACNGSCEYQTEKSKLQEPGLSPEVSSKCLHPPSSEISQPTAVLFLAVMGQGAVSALTGGVTRVTGASSSKSAALEPPSSQTPWFLCQVRRKAGGRGRPAAP